MCSPQHEDWGGGFRLLLSLGPPPLALSITAGGKGPEISICMLKWAHVQLSVSWSLGNVRTCSG